MSGNRRAGGGSTQKLTPDDIVAIKGTVTQFAKLGAPEAHRALSECLAPIAQTVMLRNLRDYDIWYRPMSMPGGVRGIAIFVGDDGLRTLRASQEADTTGAPIDRAEMHMLAVIHCPRPVLPEWVERVMKQAGVPPDAEGNWPLVTVKERGRGPRPPVTLEWQLADDVLLAANDLVESVGKVGGLKAFEKLLHPAPSEAWLLVEFPARTSSPHVGKVTAHLAWVRPQWPSSR